MTRVSRFVRLSCDQLQYERYLELCRVNSRVARLGAVKEGEKMIVSSLCYTLAAANKVRKIGELLR